MKHHSPLCDLFAIFLDNPTDAATHSWSRAHRRKLTLRADARTPKRVPDSRRRRPEAYRECVSLVRTCKQYSVDLRDCEPHDRCLCRPVAATEPLMTDAVSRNARCGRRGFIRPTRCQPSPTNRIEQLAPSRWLVGAPRIRTTHNTHRGAAHPSRPCARRPRATHRQHATTQNHYCDYNSNTHQRQSG